MKYSKKHRKFGKKFGLASGKRSPTGHKVRVGAR